MSDLWESRSSVSRVVNSFGQKVYLNLQTSESDCLIFQEPYFPYLLQAVQIRMRP